MSTLPNLPKTLKPYSYLGVEFVSNQDFAQQEEARAYCWYCEHEEGKFYINASNGLFNCKHCGEGGAFQTFLSDYHKHFADETTTDHYKTLATDRAGIPWETFRSFGWVYNEGYDEWYIPIYDRSNRIVNLRIAHKKKKWEVRGLPGLPLSLYNLSNLNGTGPVFLCEGEWDALALHGMLRRSKKKGSVLAVPGANTFKNEWLDIFTTRDVVICFDNDSAGEEGGRSTSKKLQGRANSVSMIRWPNELNDGFDVRDYVATRGYDVEDPDWGEIFDDFFGLSTLGQTVESEIAKPAIDIKRTSLRSVMNDFKKCYHTDKSIETAFSVMASTVLSIQLPGDPIWMFICGPPGTGKTLFLRAFEDSPYCIFRSSITPRSLVSGFRTDDGSDPSLIPQLNNKCLVLKDYTEILSMPIQEQEELYSILRGAYDGRCEKTFGNGLNRFYPNTYFAMLSGVTDVIHGNDRASLGERFIKFQMIENDQSYDAQQHIMAAIGAMKQQVQNDDHIRAAVASFTDRTVNPEDFILPTTTQLQTITALAEMVAALRAQVPRSGGQITYLATPEVGTRVAKQLVKLGYCLSLVRGEKGKITNPTMNILRQVALDTCRSLKSKVMEVLIATHYAKKTINQTELIALTKIPGTTLRRLLEDMTMLGTIDVHTTTAPGAIGRPSLTYSPSATFFDLWKTAGLPKLKLTVKT